MSQNQLQPVLIGGLFIGVLSALPIVSVANACCCLWVIGGGVVTAYLMQGGRPEPLELGEGALGGFLAGIAGAVIYAVVSVPIQLVSAPFQRDMLEGILDSAADVPPEVREMLESIGSNAGVGSIVIGFVFMLFIGMVFSTLGGMLGALIFRPSAPAGSAPQPPPPPPPPLSS